MSSVPGVFTNVTNTLVSAPSPLGEAIFVMGHVSADISASVTEFDTGVTGTILSYSSFGDWVSALGGALSTDNWVDGAVDDGGTTAAVAPNDPNDSLLRGLALIYAANPSAKVYAAVITGNLTDETAAPSGMQEALDEALKYQDIAYVVAPGYNPIGIIKTHCESAADASNPYNSPRMYVTGIDLFTAWDQSTATGGSSDGKPLSDADLSDHAEKSDDGLVVAYVGNHEYNFSSIFTSTVVNAVDGNGDSTYAGAREIGGQYVAAWLAGLLSAQNPVFSGTNYPSLGKTVFNGNDYIWSVTELDVANLNGWMTTRFLNNTYVLQKGITHTTDLSWKLLPHREVTNFVHKNMARLASQFIGSPLTQSTLDSVSSLINAWLRQVIQFGYISSGQATVKEHPTEVDAINVQVEFETVKPINKIYLNFAVA